MQLQCQLFSMMNPPLLEVILYNGPAAVTDFCCFLSCYSSSHKPFATGIVKDKTQMKRKIRCFVFGGCLFFRAKTILKIRLKSRNPEKKSYFPHIHTTLPCCSSLRANSKPQMIHEEPVSGRDHQQVTAQGVWAACQACLRVGDISSCCPLLSVPQGHWGPAGLGRAILCSLPR